jgi:hypothetical protein
VAYELIDDPPPALAQPELLSGEPFHTGVQFGHHFQW